MRTLSSDLFLFLILVKIIFLDTHIDLINKNYKIIAKLIDRTNKNSIEKNVILNNILSFNSAWNHS